MANEKTGRRTGPAKAKKARLVARRSKRAATQRRPALKLKGAGRMISFGRLSRNDIEFTNALTESFHRAKVAALREQGVVTDHA